MRILIAYITTIIVFLAIDSFWIGTVAADFYNDKIGHLLAEEFDLKAAAVFYLFYIAGIVYFAVRPGMTERSVKRALINGGLYGFFCYATYDLTNLATLRDWPVDMVVIDIIWGTFLSGSTAAITAWGLMKWGKD